MIEMNARQRLSKLPLILLLILASYSWAYAAIPFALHWKASDKQCSQILERSGFFKSDIGTENPFNESLKELDKVAKNYGLSQSRYKKDEVFISTVVYLDFIDNQLWQVVCRFNPVGNKAVKKMRSEIHNSLYSKFGKEYHYQKTPQGEDVIQVYVWRKDGTMIIYSFNEEKRHVYQNITRLSFADESAYKEVKERNEKMLKENAF